MSVRVLLIGLLIAAILVVTLVLASNKETPKPEFKNIEEIQMIKPQRPVSIKLKRNSGGTYTWEIKGSDVEKIIKADKELRSLLDEEE